MKYLIISDTHGKLNNAIKAIENEKCDYCIHLGDMVCDCEDLQSIFPRQKFIFVKGNNDFWTRSSNFPDQRIFTLDGKKFMVCHGHKYNVKQGLYALIAAAKNEDADIVLYGHTHRQNLEYHDGMMVLNPGASASYAVITINNDEITCEVH